MINVCLWHLGHKCIFKHLIMSPSASLKELITKVTNIIFWYQTATFEELYVDFIDEIYLKNSPQIKNPTVWILQSEMCAYIWVQYKAMQYGKCPFKDRNWTTTPLCSAVLLGFYDAALQDWGFLFDQTAAKVWHKLVDDSFLVYSVILPMNPLIYEWFNLSFKLKELKESIRVWVASWCLFWPLLNQCFTQEPFLEKNTL